jgi:hypothetical protein
VPDPTPPRPDGLPSSIDLNAPNAARMYDYMLGGNSNFAVDRAAADKVMAQGEVSTAPARLNRSFLRRSVRFMLEQGIDQFLDLGSGIPTVGNVHEIAQAANPNARVVYVDNEPVAVAHARHLLADNPNTAMVDADLRDPDSVLTDPLTTGLLDFDRPLGVLLVAVFHFIPDSDSPLEIVARYRRAARGGGHLALSHFTTDGQEEQAARGAAHYQQTATPVVARNRDEVAELFGSMPLVEPGLVWVPQWRPDGGDPALDRPSAARVYAGVSRIDPADNSDNL